MNPLLRNVLAVLAGVLIGGLINSGIIGISGQIIPPPEGADLTTEEGLKAAMPLMQPKHFLMPFLAHALGTLVGAWIAVRIARKAAPAYAVGMLFLIAGAMMVAMLPAPMWFNITDLVLAYLPMAWLATLGLKRSQ
jgi:MFS family permease